LCIKGAKGGKEVPGSDRFVPIRLEQKGKRIERRGGGGRGQEVRYERENEGRLVQLQRKPAGSKERNTAGYRQWGSEAGKNHRTRSTDRRHDVKISFCNKVNVDTRAATKRTESVKDYGESLLSEGEGGLGTGKKCEPMAKGSHGAGGGVCWWLCVSRTKSTGLTMCLKNSVA